jgi:proton-translocating NADH-quinone oxidoreductase chain N
MWPTDVMEVLFAGSMVSLLADIAGRFSRPVGRYGAGLASFAALALSIATLAMGWASSLGPMVQLQPTQSSFATLFVADKYTAFAAFTILVVGFAVSAYSMSYFKGEERRGPFYALLLILICCLVGVISAGDLLSLFLFWEGMSLSAYGLVSFERSSLSIEASIKYFLMAGVGSLFALYGTATIYSAAGSIQLSAVEGAIASGTATQFGQFGVAMLLVGLGVEAAVVPLHTWLPDVYSASSLPVASIVSGAVTGTGVFALLKVLQPLVPGGGYPAGAISPSAVSDLQILLASLALLTMVVGNVSALSQTNLRRMLSFSSVAQTGYMLAALSTLSVPGLVAVVFTIWNHGLLKSNFFMVIGKRNSDYESSRFEELRGVGRKNRLLGFLYASSSLAMVGSPPFGMFWSEILVVQALLLASGTVFLILAAAVVLNIVFSIGYYFQVINTVVFGESLGEGEKRPLADLISPVSLLALSVITGLAPFLIIGSVL